MLNSLPLSTLLSLSPIYSGFNQANTNCVIQKLMESHSLVMTSMHLKMDPTINCQETLAMLDFYIPTKKQNGKGGY